jgi:hypothetical protein
MEDTLVIRRSPFAALRWLVKPVALVLSGFIVIIMLSATRATFWLFIFLLALAMLPVSLGILYLNFNDWKDDVYTIDQYGQLRIQYRTWLKYRSIRQGPIAALQDVWVVQRGITRLLFHFGDIYITVGWARRAFVLRDVQDPYTFAAKIKKLATVYSRNNPDNTDVMAIILEKYNDEEE